MIGEFSVNMYSGNEISNSWRENNIYGEITQCDWLRMSGEIFSFEFVSKSKRIKVRMLLSNMFLANLFNDSYLFSIVEPRIRWTPRATGES